MFTEALSKNTCQSVLEKFNEARPSIMCASIRFNLTFPIRTCWRDIPVEMVLSLKIELKEILYESTYGIVQPHRDIAMCGDDTHTCLIYLTDDFTGGFLTVEDNNNTSTTLSNSPVTFAPRTGYCVIYPKGVIHYTDEQHDGVKIILLAD
eukprot:gene32739-42393_t